MSDEQRRELRAIPGDRPVDGDAAQTGGGRDQADIARLLRALNDDLRDDSPPPLRGPRVEPSASSPASPPSGRAMGGRPSTIAVAVAVVAAAAIGLGSILFVDSGTPSGGEPPNLIVPSQPSPAATSKHDDGPAPLIARGTGAAAVQAPASPPVIAPSASSAPVGLLTPGQTATIVRPQTDAGAVEGATVVVQPLAPADGGPSSAPTPAPTPVPVPAATPAKPATVAVAKPPPRSAAAPPAAAPTPSTETTPGGPGRWAVQVGTFSVSANADQLARKLSQNGRQAYVVDWQDRQGRTWKAVRVGNFTGETAARGAAAQLKSEMNLSGQVIDLR